MKITPPSTYLGQNDVTPPNLAGGGGSSSPLTTKGDVWGYDTADNRIPIGSNGQVLTADSTAALGLKWAAVTVSTSYYFARRFGV